MRGFSLQLLDFTANVGPSDTGIATGPHVVTQGQHHLLDLHLKTKVDQTMVSREQSMYCVQPLPTVCSSDSNVPAEPAP